MATLTLFDKDMTRMHMQATLDTGAKGQADWLGGGFFAVSDNQAIRYYYLDTQNKQVTRVKNRGFGEDVDGIAFVRDTLFGQFDMGSGDGEFPIAGSDRAYLLTSFLDN